MIINETRTSIDFRVGPKQAIKKKRKKKEKKEKKNKRHKGERKKIIAPICGSLGKKYSYIE